MSISPLHKKTFAVLMLSIPFSSNAYAEDIAGQLIKNSQIQFETHLDAFVDSPAARTDREIDQAAFRSFNRLTLETNADIADGVMFNGSADAIVSAPNHNRGVFSKPEEEPGESRFLDVNTAYLTFEQDSADFFIGKMTHETGYSEIYSVLDQWNISDTGNPIHKVKTGRWQAKVTYYMDEILDQEDSITFTVLPFDDRAGSVDSDSRWLGASSDSDLFFTSTNLVKQYRSSAPDQWNTVLEYKGSREGYDFTLGVSRGMSPYPVVKTEVVGITRTDYKQNPTTHNAFGGINITDDNFLYYGELLAQDALQGKDDDFVHAVVGVTYKETDWASRIGLDEVSPTIEYSREKIFNDQRHGAYSVASEGARLFRNTLTADLKIVYDSDYTLRLGTKRNLKTRDYLNNLNFEYKHNDNTFFYLNGYMFGGNQDTQFGRWEENDVVSVGYLKKF